MSEHGSGNAAWWYLDRHLAEGTADNVCLIGERGELTYRELHEAVCRAAGVLLGAGVTAGDRLAVSLPDSPEFVTAVLAALRIGAVAVPISPLLPVEEQRWVIDDCDARAVLLEDPAGPLARDLRHRPTGASVWSRRPGPDGIPCWQDETAAVAPYRAVAERAGDDPAVIQYTSGSTGRSKGVVHLHRGLLAFPRGLGGLLGITAADRVLSTAKLPFGYGFGNSLLLPFSVGASVVLFEGRVDPYAVSGLLSRYRPTLLFAVPTLYAALLAMPGAAERLDLSSVRTAVSAGEHLGAALSNRLTDAFGLRVVNGLGSTECLHIFVATEPGVTEPGLTGEPVPGFEVQVVDDHGRVLPDGGTGRLRVRGPSAADRYWRRPDLGAEVFDQGWVHTGDIMRREPGLGWRYLGREDNVLNVGGAKVLTSEIEEVLQTLPGVGSCAVVGVPDQDEVVRIVAHVVPVDADDGQLRTRLAAGLRAALPPHKRPSTIRVVAELPTTSTGKTARFRIRQTEWERTR